MIGPVPFSRADAEALIAQGEFRRFLFAALDAAGLFAAEGPAQGATPRDLSFAEGRRSLGFALLQLAHGGQPLPIHAADPIGLTTLNAVIAEALRPHPQNAAQNKDITHEPGNDEPARYGDLGSE